MNERIEEFAKQCYVKTGSPHTDYFEYWKFAELIVRECVEVELYWLSEQDRKAVAEKIQRHFGVGMSTEDKKTLIKELLGVKND